MSYDLSWLEEKPMEVLKEKFKDLNKSKNTTNNITDQKEKKLLQEQNENIGTSKTKKIQSTCK